MEKHLLITNEKIIQLPVPPSAWEVNTGNNSTTVNLLNFGEVVTGFTPKLKTWSITSIFPYYNYGFITESNFMKPQEYIDFFEKISGTYDIDIVYKITETDINIPCIIEDFSYGENDTTGNVNYTLTFKENKNVYIKDYNNVAISGGYVPTKEIGTGKYSLFVKEGDTILSICKKAYGDSSKWKQLLTQNGLQNPSQLQVGMGLIL